MASFTKADYFRLFQIACSIHEYAGSSGSAVKAHRKDMAAELADMAEMAIGQLHRPQSMRGPKAQLNLKERPIR